jgi:hypothetical protein
MPMSVTYTWMNGVLVSGWLYTKYPLGSYPFDFPKRHPVPHPWHPKPVQGPKQGPTCPAQPPRQFPPQTLPGTEGPRGVRG